MNLENFEHNGIFAHATDRIAHLWHQKGEVLAPPVEMFHWQFIIFQHSQKENLMSN
jgi:hypothetical protein